MADNNGLTDLKVEIEGLKRDVDNVGNLNSRLDTAIEKLTDVSTSIKQMLAVHEEKISRQEQIDEIIFEKLKDRAGEIDKVHQDLSKEMNHLEKRLLIEIKSLKLDITSRVGVLEKYRWMILGGAFIVGWFIALNGHEILGLMK
jgi:chromosome segregation ATPase|tara:strand:- start:442 stop:873 length:432 start_codon:yes stop_codon:yes gene_type:complete